MVAPLRLYAPVLDFGLNLLDVSANKILICNDEPTTYAQANSFKLGEKSFGAGNCFGPPANSLVGRKVSSTAITNGTVTASGLAVCWAVIDDAGTRLLATGAFSSSQSVIAGQVLMLTSFDIEMAGGFPNFVTLFAAALTPAAPTLGVGLLNFQTLSVSSAGVFDSNNKLVRTLWSAKPNYPAAANPVAAWDGTLDDMTVAPTGTYTVKLLTSSTAYTWEGAVGNNSSNHDSNLRYHNHYMGCQDMSITDAGDIFFCHGYDERWRVTHKSTVADPYHQEYPANMSFRNTSSPCYLITSDGINVYCGSGSGTVTYFYVYPCSNIHGQTTFPSATPTTTIDQLDDPNGYLAGAAVQKTGSYFFCSRSVLNSIHTVDKTSGAFIANYTGITKPQHLAVNPTSATQLWVSVSGVSTITSIHKMNVSTGGILTESGVVISGLSSVQHMEVSPDGSMLLVVDGGTAQQVKAFNTSDGTVKAAWGSSGTLGTLGGYANGPAVTNTKFMFDDPNGVIPNRGSGYIAFQPDGSFWIGDAGNNRNMHFSAGNSPTFIKKVCWIGGLYSCRLCLNDDTRFFHGWLEFKIDYSVPFGMDDNGSWTLVNNWAYGIPTADGYDSMRYVGTFSNGRTYATVQLATGGQRAVWEMTTTGWRDTGKTISNYSGVFVADDFSLWQSNYMTPDGVTPCNWYKNAFTGFDGSNNPTWAYDSTIVPNVIVFTTEALPATFPTTSCGDHGGSTRGPFRLLSNGTFPVYNEHSQYSGARTNNHCGGIHGTTGKVTHNTHPPTNTLQGGYMDTNEIGNTFLNYPEAPYFCCYGLDDYGGGSLQYKAGHSDFFTCYRGENFGRNQVNKWLHWHESGLVVGEFGVAAPYYATYDLQYPNIALNPVDISKGPFDHSDGLPPPAPPFTYDGRGDPLASGSFKGMIGLAGNSAWADIAYQNGNYYIYQNDEWYHGGATRWRVDGLDTILLSNVGTVNWNSASYVVPPTSDPVDMLAGLPYNSRDVPDGAAGWHRSLMNMGTFNSTPTQYLRIGTSFYKSDPHPNHGLMMDRSPDLNMTVQYDADIIIYKDFAVPASGDWKLDSIMNFTGAGRHGLGIIYAEILDTAGNILLRVGVESPITGALSVYCNGVPFSTPTTEPYNRFWWSYPGARRPIIVTSDIANNKLNVSYDYFSLSVSPFDTGANIAAPGRFRIKYEGPDLAQVTHAPYGYALSVHKLMFTP